MLATRAVARDPGGSWPVLLKLEGRDVLTQVRINEPEGPEGSSYRASDGDARTASFPLPREPRTSLGATYGRQDPAPTAGSGVAQREDAKTRRREEGKPSQSMALALSID